MSEKVKIRKVSDWWGEYDCSSNRNMPKHFQWISRETQDPHKLSVYVDNYIKDWGFRDGGSDKIGWLLESPQMNEGTIKVLTEDLEKTRSHYKIIFTCMDELIALGEPFKYCLTNAAPWIWEENRMIHPKSKLVSMIASNKGWLRGHQNRLEWVEKLKGKVDLYGTGREFQLKDKEDGIKDYMFSVAIENDNSDVYFTEKLTDNFVMGTVPVYYGSKKAVEKYFDPAGVIFLEDDPNLESLSEEKYHSMMPAIERNFQIAKNFQTSEDYMWENYLKDLI